MKNNYREKENFEKTIDEYVRDVAHSFGDPYDDRKNRKAVNPSLRSVANEWGISICKARQILITAGVYSTYQSRYIQKQFKKGKSHKRAYALHNETAYFHQLNIFQKDLQI